jgi:hypothetical protein
MGPGPGTYEVKGENESPHYSMTKRRSLSTNDENPGPGSYTPAVSYTNIKYSISRAQHFKKQDAVGPGPGTYSPTVQKDVSIGIGTGKRPPLSQVLDTPGPGTYDAKSSEKAPSYSIPKQSKPVKVDSDPVFFI